MCILCKKDFWDYDYWTPFGPMCQNCFWLMEHDPDPENPEKYPKEGKLITPSEGFSKTEFLKRMVCVLKYLEKKDV